MRLIVNPHKIEIAQNEAINEKEIDISICEFEFAEEITNEYVKEAYFTFEGNTYKQIIVNNECSFPSEVLVKKGMVEIGVVAYLVESGEEIKRYNPSPVYIDTLAGSLKEAKNTQPITPSEMEQYEQALNDGLNAISEAIDNAERLDIDATKTDNVATITITKQDGTTKEVEILDGETGPQGIQGPAGQDGIDGQDAKINGVNTINIVAGSNITLNQTGDTLEISSTDTTYNNATTETSGLMSSEDKTKLNGIASGAEVNVQANWNETNSSSDSYIQNKPSIPTVNNATLTIQKNSTTLDTFTANASSDKTINITVPTDTQDLTNGAGFTTNTGTITSVKMNGTTVSSSGEADLGTVITQHQDISGKLDTSAVKTTTNTTQGNVYDVTYINTMLGDIESLLGGI